MHKLKNKARFGVPIGSNYVNIISEANGTVTVAFYQDQEGLMELGGIRNRQTIMSEEFADMVEAKALKPEVDPRRKDQDARKDIPNTGRNIPTPEKDFIDMMIGDIIDDANDAEQNVNVKKQGKLPKGHVKGSQVKSGGEVKTKIQEGMGDTYKKDDIVNAMMSNDIRRGDIKAVLAALFGQEVTRETSAVDIEEAVEDELPVEGDESGDGEKPDQNLGANPEAFSDEEEAPSVKMDSIEKGMEWDRFRDKTTPISVKKLLNLVQKGMVFREVETDGLKISSITQKSVRRASYSKSQGALTISFSDNTDITLQDIGDGEVFVSDDNHIYYNT